MNYEFFISYNLGTPVAFQVYPIFDSLNIEYRQEQGQIFFRQFCDTTFKFINNSISNDYNSLIGLISNPCDEIKLLIRRKCDASSFWIGYCNYYDFAIDEDQCSIEARFTVDDDYRCFLENGDVKHNFIPTLTNHTVTSDTDFEFEILRCQQMKKNSGAPSGGCIEISTVGGPGTAPSVVADDCFVAGVGYQLYDSSYKLVDFGTRTTEILTRWIRQVKTTIDIGGVAQTPAGSGWINIGATTLDGSDATKWARQPFNGIYTTYVKHASDGMWDYTPAQWDDLGLYFTIVAGVCNYYYRLTIPPQEIDYTQFKQLSDVIQFLSDETCSGFTYESRFFEDASNPLFPVPGNPLNNLMIAQKSDIVDPDATEKATIGEISFLRMMEILRDMFQAYWFIDGNTLRIEHIAYWSGLVIGYDNSPGVDFDLTTRDDGKNIKSLNKYRFSKEKMPNRETFEWMESGNIDFIGKDIIYSGVCTNQRVQEDEKKYQLLDITTDIWYIQNNPTDISNDGFVMVIDESLQIGDTYAVNGVLSGEFISNAPLSWANLQNLYWRYERVLIDGNMNDASTTFYSAIKIKIQTPVGFQVCCENFDPNELIKTQIGDGEVIDAILNLITGELTVNLKHN